jgi:hypothetical protein
VKIMLIKEIIQGASASWLIALANYKPSNGWVMKYYFRGPGAGLDLESTSVSDEFVLQLSAAQTTVLSVGEYAWQSFVEKDSEKVFVAEGVLQIKRGLAALNVSETFDTRSEIKKSLDAIDACLAKKATADQLSYTIGNRQLSRYSMSDLIMLRDKYQKLYNQEKIAAKLKKGGGIFKTHLIRIKE